MGGNTDIYAVSVDQPNKPRPVVATSADERFPELSRDGRWLAYCSDETGPLESYVEPHARAGRRVTITNGGAGDPAWSKNSNELFYRNGNQILAVRFAVSGD